ncbi:MAG: amidase [Deltaproteobacteria bacterium]|nr:amidase [Deltaproteobacteria bacterium]
MLTTVLVSLLAATPGKAHAKTQASLDKISQLDAKGPSLHAMIEVNPDALSIADALDAKLAPANAPLYGEPIVVKDNLDTGDKMQTSAGSLALVGAPAKADSTVVAKLRAAGMVLVGKTNLSEWANLRSSHSTSGWSGRGGQTRNPYATARNPCGSSSGSGVAVAAGYVAMAIGTETDGSIVCPAAFNGVVGLKPTVGLVSRAGIVPISHRQDTAGPIAVDVAHAAKLLTVIAGPDAKDPATAEAGAHATDYSRFLDANALKGARIGVVRKLAGFDPAVDKVLDDAVAAMKAAGATVIDVELPHLGEYGDDELQGLLYDFKADLNAYLATRTGVPVKTMADVIAFNQRESAKEMSWFGQDLMEKAQAKGPLTEAAYVALAAKIQKLAGPEGIDAALAKDKLDALIAPTVGVPTLIDYIGGDFVSGSSPTPAAVAGYPDLSVPAGYVHGLPVGLSFFAGKWSEPKLISLGYAFEQKVHARKPATFPVDVIHVAP